MTSHWMDEPVTEPELARVAEAAGGLAASVRDLIDAVIRSEVDPDELDTVRGEVEALTKRLRVQQIPGSFGETHGSTPDPFARGATPPSADGTRSPRRS